MRRRNVLTAIATVTSGVTILSTGAFSGASATRNVSIALADDNDAFLKLTELGEGGRSYEDGNEVKLSFPSMSERAADPDLGIGPSSIYEFDQDADEAGTSNPEKGLLRIENQGTQPIKVYSNGVSNPDINVELYDVTDVNRTALRDSPVVLTVGQSVDIGVRIQTYDTALGNFEETLKIIATAA